MHILQYGHIYKFSISIFDGDQEYDFDGSGDIDESSNLKIEDDAFITVKGVAVAENEFS